MDNKAMGRGYTDLRQAGSQFSDIIGIEEGVDDRFDGRSCVVGHPGKSFDDWHALQQLSFAERYREGRLSLCFVFGSRKIAKDKSSLDRDEVFVLRAIKNDEPPVPGRLRFNGFGQSVSLDTGEDSALSAQDEKAVLVLYVEGMDQSQAGIPSKVRFERGYRFNDLFAGDLYASVLDGRRQAIRFLGEGKVDFRVNVSGDAEHGEIQCGPQVVNGISDDGGEGWRDGLLLFDSVGDLSGLAVDALDKFERPLGEEGRNLGFEIIDVVCGPL